MRSVAVLIALLGVACEESISLGSECPSQSGRCSSLTNADRDGDSNDDGSDATPSDAEMDEPEDATTQVDAGHPEAGAHDGGHNTDGGGPRDATISHDASDASPPQDAGPPLFPAFRNPSFEITIDGGTTGALGLERPAPIEPWYGCRSGMEVDSEVTIAGSGRVVHPTEGSTFFADSFPNTALNVSGVAQELSEPLRAGQRYAFAADVWAEYGALMTGGLELQVASGLLMYLGPLDCILSGFTVLGSSGSIEPGDWRSVCVTFTPARDVSTVTLMAGAPTGFTNWGARMFVDNIRPGDCK